MELNMKSTTECLDAVSTDGMLLQYIKDPSDDIITAAVNQNGLAIKYVPIMHLFKRKQDGGDRSYDYEYNNTFIFDAVNQNGLALQHIPFATALDRSNYDKNSNIMNITDLYFTAVTYAVTQTSDALKYIILNKHMLSPMNRDKVFTYLYANINSMRAITSMLSNPIFNKWYDAKVGKYLYMNTDNIYSFDIKYCHYHFNSDRHDVDGELGKVQQLLYNVCISKLAYYTMRDTHKLLSKVDHLTTMCATLKGTNDRHQDDIYELTLSNDFIIKNIDDMQLTVYKCETAIDSLVKLSDTYTNNITELRHRANEQHNEISRLIYLIGEQQADIDCILTKMNTCDNRPIIFTCIVLVIYVIYVGLDALSYVSGDIYE